jgi:probable F420-dependent oxidoreductase
MTTDRLGRVGVWFTKLGDASAAAEREAVAEIEALGYPALWFGETPQNKEAFTHAGLLLAASSTITIATGIANIHARDAQAARSAGDALGEAYDGRFVLGLGASHQPLVESRGGTYGKPLTAMREYLDALDAATYGPPAPAEPVPIVLAALRPRMLELARERTAGAHSYLVPVEHTVRAREVLGAGKLLAPELTVVLEADPEAARARARAFTQRYLALPNYVENLRWLGFGDEDFAGGGSDRLVDALIAWGDAEAIAARVGEHLAAGADHVCIQPLADDVGGGLAVLRELRPALASL